MDDVDDDELDEDELDGDGMDTDVLGLDDGPVVELVEIDDEDSDPDDDDVLLAKDNAVIGDVTLLDNEPIVEGTLILDGVLVEPEIPGKSGVIMDVLELEGFGTEGLAKELVGKVGMELPLPTVEVALEDEGISW